MRILQEETEERQEETALAAFKASKRFGSKRKDDESFPGNQNKKRKLSNQEGEKVDLEEPGIGVDDVAGPPEREAGIEEIDQVEDMTNHPEEEVPSTERGRILLSQLRARMEAEKAEITNLMDTKKEEDIIQGINILWKDPREGKPAKLNHWLPTGWKNWWQMIENEAETDARRSRLSRSKLKQEDFKERTMPNILLTGWRGWWARMQAEAMKDAKMQDEIKDNKRMTDYFKPGRISQGTPGGRKKEAESGTCPSPGTPKRKSSSLHMGESPFKRRKINFQNSLSFWKTVEGGGLSESCTVPTCIAVHDLPPYIHGPIESISDNDSKVVKWQNGPGGDEYCGRCTDMQPGSET